MTLTTAIEAYLRLKRSLGAKFVAEERILRAFARACGDRAPQTLSAEDCHRFCRGTGPPTRFWERKHQTLRGFFRYLIARGQLPASPLPEPGPKRLASFEPYIYSHNELQRLLDATTTLATARDPLRPLTFRTLLLALYGAGLRPSEGLRLRCCDVDLRDRLLAVWDTKFFKSRWVPIGTSLCQALERYRTERLDVPRPAGPRSAFFASATGHAFSLRKLDEGFARVRQCAGVQRPRTQRFQPRLQDLRHSFAVHRLIAWYREDADVQARLPLLATYLGHVNLCATQTYLTMTPELLTEASRRFERYASLG
jgi:site-specific recombinase XerD